MTLTVMFQDIPDTDGRLAADRISSGTKAVISLFVNPMIVTSDIA